MNELALFSGAGGGILGGKLLGWNCICGVELDPYAREVLGARQNEKCLTPFPIWDDVCTFDGRPWQGRVDVVSGGFPCTDISIAGKGEGIDGAESKLWGEQARIIGEVLPCYVLIENSPALTFRGGVRVIADLAAMGYDCRWGIISAADAIWSSGRPCIDQLRDRIWIAATRSHADSRRWWADITRWDNINRETTRRHESDGQLRTVREPVFSAESADAQSIGCGSGIMRVGTSETFAESGNDCAQGSNSDRIGELQPQGGERDQRERIGDSGIQSCDAAGARLERQREIASGTSAEHGDISDGGWWSVEPDVDRMATGVPNRVDRLRCIGMAQVPAVVRLAWKTLMDAPPLDSRAP